MKRIGCIVAIVTAIGVVVVVLLPAFISPCTKAPIASEMNRLKQIGIACMIYAMDHDGAYPPDFVSLTNYADKPLLYVSRHDLDNAGAMSNVMEWTSFVYNRGITTASPPDTIVAYLPPGHFKKKNGGVILFADGRVEWKPLNEFTRTLNETPTKDCTLSTEGAPSVEK